MLDREAPYNSCRVYLDIKRPTFSNLLYRLLVQLMPSLTTSLRFNSGHWVPDNFGALLAHSPNAQLHALFI